jgi:hypothetical protein
MLHNAVGPEQIVSEGMMSVTESYRDASAGSYALTPTRLLWCCERDYVPSVEGFAHSQVRTFRPLSKGLGSELEVTLPDRVLRLPLMPWDGGGPKEPAPTYDCLMAALTAQGAERFDAAPMPGPVWETQVAFGGGDGVAEEADVDEEGDLDAVNDGDKS